MKGVGVHVFAGGFTMGVKQVLPVVGQLEIHDFGRETCEAHHTEFMNADAWEGWRDYKSFWKDCSFCYGNPRCTSFSSYSAGAGSRARGPFAEPTRDIWDLIELGLTAKLDVISFESVQQAYSVGRPLIKILVEKLVTKKYRVAHLFVNTAAEGNAQKRRRYFFVAYKNNRNFNVMIPNLPKYRTTCGDVLEKFINRKTNVGKFGSKEYDYDGDSYRHLNDREQVMIPYLREGESFTSFAKRRPEELERVSKYHYDKWMTRTSGLPFSLHAPTRVRWDGHCPTICSTSKNLIHPRFDRPLTVREIAALMGWPKNFIPIGRDPVGQIGKGVVPATGKWLAEQIKLYLENFWGEEDFESEYRHRKQEWVGNDFIKTNKPVEKVFRLTNYLPPFRKEQRNELQKH